MRRAGWVLVALLATGAAAGSADQRLTVTVYNNNFALVEDVRHLIVPAGRTKLEFKDVLASIHPETVALAGNGLSVVEQNFDYDLLTPAKMMEKAVGRQIQIIRTNPATGAQTIETATVLSVNEGVVLKIGNRIEVLRDDGIPTRVVFSSIPENLRAQPTLSVTVDAANAGARDVTLSYLTTGLSWKADYVALYDEKQGSIALAGWVTLVNKSGTSFKDVRTQLVAGEVSFAGSEDEYWARDAKRRQALRNGGTGSSAATSVGDYDLFALPEKVTIADNQTKQVAFLDLKGVKTQKAYEYEGRDFNSGETEHAQVVLKFSNVGRALPSGIVRAYIRNPKGQPTFAGEDMIDHSPAGSDIAVKIGEAFDVTVEPISISAIRLGPTSTHVSMSYTVRNARDGAVTVDIRQYGIEPGGKVQSENLPSKRINARTLGWSVPVAAHGETVLTFTIDTGS